MSASEPETNRTPAWLKLAFTDETLDTIATEAYRIATDFGRDPEIRNVAGDVYEDARRLRRALMMLRGTYEESA